MRERGMLPVQVQQKAMPLSDVMQKLFHGICCDCHSLSMSKMQLTANSNCTSSCYFYFEFCLSVPVNSQRWIHFQQRSWNRSSHTLQLHEKHVVGRVNRLWMGAADYVIAKQERLIVRPDNSPDAGECKFSPSLSILI